MSFKKIVNYIAILIFMAILVVPSILWYLFSFSKVYDFDLGEKRNKATLSEILNIDDLPSELERYYNDRLPFRSMIIKEKTIVDSHIEDPYNRFEKKVIYFLSKYGKYGVTERIENKNGKLRKYMDDAVDIYRCHGLKKTEIDPYDINVKYPVKYSDNHKVIIGQSDWLFLNDANIPLYVGNRVPDVSVPEYTKICEKFAEMCNEMKKKSLFMVCPEKEEIYPEYMPYMDIKDEKERCLYERDYIATASDINFVYPKEELLEKKSNYLLYKKYDSHWNDVGAYIGYESAMNKLGFATTPIEEIELKKTDMRDCGLFPLGNLNESSFAKSFDYDVMYKPDIEVRRFELPGNAEKISYGIESNVDGNTCIFILGDSFSHNMLQYISKDFKKMYFINLKDLIDDTISAGTVMDCLIKSDVVVLEFVERNDPDTMPYFCHWLINLYEGMKNSNGV